MVKCAAPLTSTDVQNREQASQPQVTRNHVWLSGGRLVTLLCYKLPTLWARLLKTDSVLANDGIVVRWLLILGSTYTYYLPCARLRSSLGILGQS
jgi:hypothetical protein